MFTAVRQISLFSASFSNEADTQNPCGLFLAGVSQLDGSELDIVARKNTTRVTSSSLDVK